MIDPGSFTATAGWYPCGEEGRVQYWDGAAWSGRWTDAQVLGRMRWRPRLLVAAWVMVATVVVTALMDLAFANAAVRDAASVSDLDFVLWLLALGLSLVASVWLLVAAAGLNRHSRSGGVRAVWLIACILLTVACVMAWLLVPELVVWPSLLYAGLVVANLGWKGASRVRAWSVVAPLFALAGLPLGVLVGSGLFGTGVMHFGPSVALMVAAVSLVITTMSARRTLVPTD